MASGITYKKTGYLQYVIVLIIICGAGTSCRKAGLFEQAGKQTTESRTLNPYNEIVLYDKINLVLRYDTAESVTVQCGKNLIAGIVTNVADKTLTIRDDNKFKWSRNLDENITVVIGGRQLEKITYYGSGNVESANEWTTGGFEVDSWNGVGRFRLNLNTDYLRLIIRMANADIAVTGRAGVTYAYIADHGSIDLAACPSDSMVLDCRSIRKSVINVKYKLDVKIHYTGDIYYFGDPLINLFRNNKGQLIKAG